MKKPKLTYFENEDVLHLIIEQVQEAKSFEVFPNITVEFNAQGKLIGIEFLNASVSLRDLILNQVTVTTSAQSQLAELGGTESELEPIPRRKIN